MGEWSTGLPFAVSGLISGSVCAALLCIDGAPEHLINVTYSFSYSYVMMSWLIRDRARRAYKTHRYPYNVAHCVLPFYLLGYAVRMHGWRAPVVMLGFLMLWLVHGVAFFAMLAMGFWLLSL